MIERFPLHQLQRTSRQLCALASHYPVLAADDHDHRAAKHVELFAEATDRWPTETWRTASLAAAMQGISEILDFMLSTHHTASIPTAFRERLAHQARLNTERVALQREECVNLISAAASHDIETIILKGMVAAHTLYRHPGHRPMADVDLLVHSRELVPTVRAMTAEGFRIVDRTEKHIVICPVGNEDYPHTWSDHPNNRRSVEIHDSLYYDPLKVRVRIPDAVFQRSEHCDLGGHTVRCLCEVDAAIVCALDLADSLFSRTVRFVKMIDLVLITSRLEDIGRLTEVVEGMGQRVARYAYPIFALAARSFQSRPCGEIAERLAPYTSSTMRRLFEKASLGEFSYANPIPTYLGRFEGFRLAPKLIDKFSASRNLVIPEREWHDGGFLLPGRRPWFRHYAGLLRKLTQKTVQELNAKPEAEVIELEGFE